MFKVKLNSIKEKKLAKIDDEFAKDVSEFQTLDEYKKDLKAKLLEAKKKQASLGCLFLVICLDLSQSVVH